MKSLILAALLLTGCTHQLSHTATTPLYPEEEEQPFSCEDYLANDLPPYPGCKHEPRGETR